MEKKLAVFLPDGQWSVLEEGDEIELVLMDEDEISNLQGKDSWFDIDFRDYPGREFGTIEVVSPGVKYINPPDIKVIRYLT